MPPEEPRSREAPEPKKLEPEKAEPKTPEPTHGSPATEVRPTTSGARATRHGLLILGAKVYFIVSGLVQQVLLGRILGLAGYGALSTVLSASSIAYNPLVQASLQGVSRGIAKEPGEPALALRQMLRVHAAVAAAVALGFLGAAPWLASLLKANHLAWPLATLSGVLLSYGLYAPLVGALNGTGRLHLQALFDVVSATLRSLGLILGAYFGLRWAGLEGGAVGPGGGGVEGAALGFLGSSLLVLVACAWVTGVGRAGGTSPAPRDYLARLLPLTLGQALLNLLFQADSLLLRFFAAGAALAENQPERAADVYVGAYRTAQLFSLLPYQLLSSVTLVLFPILAHAQAREGERAVANYVAQGTRLALLLLGAMISVLAAFPHALVGLVYGAEASALGGPTLAVLGPGLAILALLGVVTTCLNGLGHETKTFWSMAAAVVLVGATITLLTFDSPLGQGLLLRTALGTSLGLLFATALSGWFLYREVGPWLKGSSLLRIVIASALTAALGRQLEPSRHALVVVFAPLAGLTYLALLLGSGELSRAELARFFRGRRTPSA